MEIGFQNCAICKTKNEIKTVISTLECEDFDLDSRPRGIARLAEKNFVSLCENCGYANYALDFDITEGDHRVIESKEYQEIFKNQELIVDAKKFYLQGMILEDMENLLKAAYAYLRAAWFFNDNQNKEWMIKSRQKAINCLLNTEQTYKNAKTYSILIDCYRRIGDFSSALKAIDSFDKSLINDEYLEKLFIYEKMLCESEDSLAHSTKEVYEKVI